MAHLTKNQEFEISESVRLISVLAHFIFNCSVEKTNSKFIFSLKLLFK